MVNGALRVRGEPTRRLNAGAGLPPSARCRPFPRQPPTASPLPKELIEQLFQRTPGEVVSAATPTGQVVARLTKVIPADPASAGPALTPVERQVAQGVAGDLISQYLEAMRQRHPVTIYQERLQSRFSPN